VILSYEDFLKRERAKQRGRPTDSDEVELPAEKKDIVEVRDFRMFNGAGQATDVFEFGDDIYFEFEYVVKRPIERLTFCFTVRNAESNEVYMADKRNPDNTINSAIGVHSLKVRLNAPNLLGGEYMLSGELWNNDAAFYVGYSNRRQFWIAQSKYLGTGVTFIDRELENDSQPIRGEE
jgi:teichoic acid transport system ATP-binding protein